MDRVLTHLGLTRTADFERTVDRYELRPSSRRIRTAESAALTASLAGHLDEWGYS